MSGTAVSQPVVVTSSPETAGKLHTELPLPSSAIKQIDGLQVLRGVALLIVVWGHAGLPFIGPGLPNIPDMGIYGIDIFFVLSGFILSSVVLRTRRQPGLATTRHFLLRRLIRIFPIYWFFASVGLLMVIHGHQFTFRTYLPPLLLLPFPEYPNCHFLIDFSWTLVYEMYFYFLLSVLQLFTVRRAVQALIVFLSLCSLAPLFISVRRPILLVAGNPILLEFVFGALVALAFQRFGRRRLLGIALLALGICASLACRHLPSDNLHTIIISEHYIHYTPAFTWGIAATLLVAGTVFWLPTPRGRLGRFALFAGNSSYSGYLGSGYIIIWGGLYFLHHLSPAHLHSTGIRFLLQILLSVVAIGLGMVVYQFVEWPMLRRLQKMLGTAA